jgi:FdhE protein
MTGGKWDRRIQRANELAGTHAFAAEGLRFYQRIAGFQKTLYASVEAERGATRAACPPGGLRQELEPLLLLPWFASFLSLVTDAAPAPLSRSAAELGALGVARWQEVLDELWRADEDTPPNLAAAEALIAWTFLQPYAECLADHSDVPPPAEADAADPAFGDATPYLCPLCSRRPQVGVLRPLGDGAKRSLICALCATEWDFRRIACPACGEESVDKLPIYVADELPHVRVEACDTCRHYIKTIDLTKNGRAVPVVDELAAIPLSLWAEENRYAKLHTNLLGI